MTRLHFKGGAWTNSEDQVLRASLTVYGLQNWERVASTLVKKTATQCRERWENFLDPRLNINEAWTAEEEENLVQLQSLFPNQWSLISQEVSRRCGMNRPAWLCEEQYHSLLDALEYRRQQESSESRNSASLTLGEFLEERKRQRGVHRGIETRTARPDAVNMEASEKEMVEFAMSRLANQDGKKGLRKERRKQLEHTSFLAKLQSNREAIESGTLSARAKKRMERAMMEDRSGPSEVYLVDSITEDIGEGGEGEESIASTKGKFQPIDLGTDKRAAGIQPKQRVLVKELRSTVDSDAGLPPPKGASSTGLNLNLLRVASAGAASLTPQLENNKGVASLEWVSKSTGSGCSVGEPRSDADPSSVGHERVDLDDLFASLPRVVDESRKLVAGTETNIDTLFGDLPDPFPGNHEAEEGLKEVPSAPASEDFGRSSSRPSVGSVGDTPVLLDFTSPSGRTLLGEAKRRVAAVGRHMFLHSKRSRGDSYEQCQGVNEVVNDDLGDGTTRQLVYALIANQLGITTQLLLHGSAARKGCVNGPAAITQQRKGVGAASLGLRRGGGVLDEQVSKVAECQEESDPDLWRSVKASEAIIQLDNQLHQQRRQVEALVSECSESVGSGKPGVRCPERIISVCFSPRSGNTYICPTASGTAAKYGAKGDGCGIHRLVQSICLFWSERLREAQRKLIFYTEVRRAEQREMKRRLECVASQLEAVEQKERTLQEEFRNKQVS